MTDIVAVQEVVIRDASAWAEFWAKHKQHLLPQPPLPRVDFSRQMVVGIVLPGRPNGCYAVAIDKIEQETTGLAVSYKETTPPRDAMCSMAIVWPVHLVKTARTDSTVVFRRLATN